jgi:organic radical activating enzyme
MTSIRESIHRFLQASQPLPAGTYHYQAPPSDPDNYRLHLRLEEGGSGVLIVNAATILHLNQTAAEFAFYLIQNTPEEQVVKNVASRYRIKKDQVKDDYRAFVERVNLVAKTPDLDPATYLDFERTSPYADEVSAPYRLDCALTYRLPEGSTTGSAPTDRVERELDTNEWKTILDKSWNAGIPHIVLTGGEPTLRDDLAELIRYAESHGQVTGLMTDGLRLAEPEYLQELLQTGLDHLTMILQPEKELSWQALEAMLPEDLFVAVHLTITRQNRDQIQDLIKKLAKKGVKAISLSAAGDELDPDLEAARELEAALDIDLVWNLPTPYSDHNPISLETENQELHEGAGKAWLYVEPDGDILPLQGMNKVIGNFLTDSWEDIWTKCKEL